MTDKDVKEGAGVIESKAEAVTQGGDKYWKFKIDGKMFSLFNHEEGNGVSVGDSVGMYWTETQKGNITYRNLSSIFKQEVPVETVSDTPQPAPAQTTTQKLVPPKNASVQDFQTKDADKFELGMAKNNAALFVSKLVEKIDDTKAAEDYLKQCGPLYEELVEGLYTKGKEIRKKLIGY